MLFRKRSRCTIRLALAFGMLALSSCGAPDWLPSANSGPGAGNLAAPTATAADAMFAPLIIKEGYPAPAPSRTGTPASPSRTPTPVSSKTPTAAPTAVPGAIWRPAPGTTWQWQLTGLPVDQSFDVTMYDIDLFDNDARIIAELHAHGRKVICYISAGTWESWRPDANQFPEAIKGNKVDNWPGERWLDISNLAALTPIMAARMDLCKAKGFDGVEPDNVDGYTNDTGFDLRAEDQLAYNTLLANMGYQRGLSVGLKNDLDQVSALEPLFDWAMNEQCFQYAECDPLRQFVQANKAVFQVEYKLKTSDFCAQAIAFRFSSMLKDLNLNAYRAPCG